MHVLSYVYSYIYIHCIIYIHVYRSTVSYTTFISYYIISCQVVFIIHTLPWYVSISVKQQDVACFTSSIWGPYYDAGRPLWCLQLAGKVHPMAVALDSTDLPRILVGGWLWIFESLGPMLFESKSKSFRWVAEQDCISILIQSCEV